MGKLTEKYVADTPRKITATGLQKSSAKLIPANSIILSTRAPIGYIAINTDDMATNQGCRGIIPDESLDSHYLYYFLSISTEKLNSLGTGATFRELSTRALASIELPLPPFDRQQIIVQKFEAISEAARKMEAIQKEKLTDLEELKKSFLHKAFSGELTTIKELVP